MGLNPTFDAQQKQRADRSRDLENSARHGFATAEYDSTGWGEIVFEDCFEFGMTFTSRPHMFYGFEVKEEGNDLVATRYPRGSGFVYKWRRNGKGFYTGAWVGCTVYTQDATLATVVVTEPNYSLTHFFMFTAMGMKDLPDHKALR